MSRTITVSFPVADLKVSRAFYAALGVATNPQLTDGMERVNQRNAFDPKKVAHIYKPPNSAENLE